MAPSDTLFASSNAPDADATPSTTISVQTPVSRFQDEAKEKPAPAADAIPNGGLQAWLQVFGAFLLFFNSWGIINTYGAFQAYYELEMLKSTSSSSISWIGTVQAFLLIIFGLIGGPAFDKGFYRELIAGGTIFLVFGLMMTSLCTEYYQIFLAQGICVGLGSGAVFLPSVAMVATYFSTKRALATGITAAGGSVGSVIYTVVFRKLQPRLGFAWTTRVIGFIVLGTLLVSLSIMRSRSPRDAAKKARKLVDLSAFQSVPFNICITGMFVAFIGLYVPFFDIITYAETHVHVNEDMSFYLLSIMNAASALGRIIPGLLADRFGSPIVLATLTLCSAVLVFAWVAIDSLAGLIVFSILYGFVSGGVVSLPVSIIASLTNHLGQVGTWMGMAFCFNGLGILIGNPIAGTLINAEEDDYVRAIIFAGATIVGGGIIWWILWAYMTFIKPKPKS